MEEDNEDDFYEENDFTLTPPEYSIFTQPESFSDDDLFDSPSRKKGKVGGPSFSASLSNAFFSCKSTTEDIHANKESDDFDINENTLDMFSSPKNSKINSNIQRPSDSQNFNENIHEQQNNNKGTQDFTIASGSQYFEQNDHEEPTEDMSAQDVSVTSSSQDLESSKNNKLIANMLKMAMKSALSQTMSLISEDLDKRGKLVVGSKRERPFEDCRYLENEMDLMKASIKNLEEKVKMLGEPVSNIHKKGTIKTGTVCQTISATLEDAQEMNIKEDCSNVDDVNDQSGDKVANLKKNIQQLGSVIKMISGKNNDLNEDLQICIMEKTKICEEKNEIQIKLDEHVITMQKCKEALEQRVEEKEGLLKKTEERLREVEEIANVLRIKIISQEKEAMTQTQSGLQKFMESEESYLHCSICHEILIFATSINCGHMFCSPCIEMWTGRKLTRKKTCPSCREVIKSKIRNVQLDNFIEQFINMCMTPDFKQERRKLIRQRNRKVNDKGYMEIVSNV